jgi:hypothetical protein
MACATSALAHAGHAHVIHGALELGALLDDLRHRAEEGDARGRRERTTDGKLQAIEAALEPLDAGMSSEEMAIEAGEHVGMIARHRERHTDPVNVSHVLCPQ